MSDRNRSTGYRVSVTRNIHFVDGQNDEIGGAWQNGALTWSEMAEWMEITFQTPINGYAPFPCLEPGDPVRPLAQHGPVIIMQGNDNIITPGFYVILSPQGNEVKIPINQENPIPRTTSRATSSEMDNHTKTFRNRVRTRDGRCVITRTGPIGGDFIRLSAAHIFPIAHLGMWKSESWHRQITDDKYDGESGINSVQNGILLRSDVHDLFDTFYIAVNPDRDYKTYCFLNDPTLDNLIMFRATNTVDKYQPCRALLKHLFKMCVLLNMKGRTGYPVWDEDIPPGCDDMTEVSRSKEGKLRLETILAGKLNSSLA
ncbi:hypothetical protein V495_07224 [Pseudogymnoascus sp. VKM F-4514 (FW-929)]|nr:hypothetical protein V495_07224 [Pseudogymnoascus sp. VKM F-4514 (FW-929)]KFY51557.1 hypothetical protein V497_09033 [Pseudogymnoascus sp. VKM F-4516 (FW-969)]